MSVGSHFVRSLVHVGGLVLLFGCDDAAPQRANDTPAVELATAGGMGALSGGGNAAGMPDGGLSAGGRSPSSGTDGGAGVAAGAGGASAAGAAPTAGASAVGGFAGRSASIAGASAAGTSAAGASAVGAAGSPPLDSRQAFDTAIAALAGLDATSITQRYPTAFQPAPTYDP